MKYFKQLEPLMQESGKLVMGYFRKQIDIAYKKDGSIVTVADQENEAFLKKALYDICKAGFYAEESGLTDIDQDYVWVIDPIDGTNNFAQGLPHFCISVALTYQGDPVVAATYNPTMQELYYAEKGQGAWCNGRQLLLTSGHESYKRLAAIGDMCVQQFDMFECAENNNFSMRAFGSAALDAAYLAAGYIDLLLFRKLAWWDVAAGILLVQEAGGLVTQFDGTAVKNGYTSFLAGEKDVHQQFLSLIKGKI